MEMRNDFRKFFTIVGILALAVFAPLGRGQAAEKEKVILDTDMVELLDDGVAMMMLAQAPNIQLEGGHHRLWEHLGGNRHRSSHPPAGRDGPEGHPCVHGGE
jgi:hypothetical protein